jgi:type II secretory pathway pseudopilin PulG
MAPNRGMARGASVSWRWLRERASRGDEGFTLIELVAAMGMFAVAVASLLGVLVAGIRTAALARDRTVAKDLARQRLEDMRRLPFYQSYSTFPRKADLLDTYFPTSSGTGYSTVANSAYCGTAATCPRYTVSEASVAGFPRYRMEIVTRFIDESLAAVVPATGYQWNSASADRPPTRLVSVDISVFWGKTSPRSFVLRSHLGESVLEDVVLSGSATGTVVRVDTGFSDDSTLLVEGGKGTSNIFVGNTSSARNETIASSVRLTQADGTTAQITGAQSVGGGPPDVGPLSATDSVGSSLAHPNTALTGLGACDSVLRCIATIGSSLVENVTSIVTATPPSATGRLTLRNGTVTDEGGQAGLTATNQVDAGDYRKLDASKAFVRVRKVSGFLQTAKLDTSCSQATDTAGCVATGSVGELRMVPLAYGAFDSTGGYLVTVRFTDLTARATARRLGGSGSGTAQVTFCGTVTYWSWNGSNWVNNTVRITNTPATCGTAGALPDPSTVSLGTVDGRAMFLSDYISSWAVLGTGTTTLSADQTRAEAILDGALRITTTPTNLAAGYENSGVLVRVGTVRAEAVDSR